MKLGPKCSKMPPHLRRALSRIAVALLLCVFISGVGIGRAQTNTFRLGVSCPLSGVLAEYGAAVRNGIELARKEQPELFSRTEIVYEDSQWDPKKALCNPHDQFSGGSRRGTGPRAPAPRIKVSRHRACRKLIRARCSCGIGAYAITC